MIRTIQGKIFLYINNLKGGEEMTKRTKQEFNPTLKAEDYDSGKVVISSGIIDSVKERHTKFNEEGENSLIVSIKDQMGGIVDIFLNQQGINNLVNAYGEEDGNWVGKQVRVTCNRDNYMKKKQLLIEAFS